MFGDVRVEFNRCNRKYESEKEFFIYYEGVKVGRHVLDLLIEGLVVVEVGTVEFLGKAHYAQVRSYPRPSPIIPVSPINVRDRQASDPAATSASRQSLLGCRDARDRGP